MKTNFKFDITNTKTDCESICIIDKSEYNTDLPITDAQLRVTLPNFGKYVDIEYFPKNITIINSAVLKLSKKAECLPSGLYRFRFSICPNDKLYKEYLFFNVCNELNILAVKICNMIEMCLYPEKELKELYLLKEMFLTAKDIVEICGECEKGIWLYNEALKKLNSICDGM